MTDIGWPLARLSAARRRRMRLFAGLTCPLSDLMIWMPARMCGAALTTLHQPMQEIGQQAVQLLLLVIRGEAHPDSGEILAGARASRPRLLGPGPDA